jgi:glyoxylase I family protein
MPQLKHIAIATQDPERAAKFFTQVFDMQIRGQINSRNATGYYLSDGNINIALLKYKNDPAAGMEHGMKWTGIHHLGFHVEDIEQIAERFKDAGYEPRHDINIAQGLGANPDKDNAEYKFSGPEGIVIDVSEKGWVGTSPLHFERALKDN